MKNVVIVLALALSLIAAITYAQLDYPHSGVNDIGCENCHFLHNTTEKFLKDLMTQESQNIDDTLSNNLCWSCHNDVLAPYVRTHSSLQTDDDYGNWSMECRQCHWPHQQPQFRSYGSEGYLYSNTSTSISNTTLTRTEAGWTTDQYKGLVVVPNIAKRDYSYKITGNTDDTLTIAGPVDLTKATPGDTFAIIYGKLIKSTLPTPNSGSKLVRFFRSTGNDSFADGDSTYTGVCEACHTKTDHHRNDNSGGDHTHNLGVKCTNCHGHISGFKAMGGGAHPTHLTAQYGPKITCEGGDNGCHGSNDPPVLRDGGNLTNTTVCNDCHSSNGVATAKQYWNSPPGSSTGANGSWAASESYASFCGSCHDETPGMADQNFSGAGDLASNVTGDNSTYGFFVTGHGLANDTNYTRLSWQDTSASGNPGANKTCSNCHELTATHYNNSAKRLKAGYENDANNTVCQQCHDPGTAATNGPQWYTTYTDFQNSAHYQKPGSFGTGKCTACHDVHGAAGAYTAMTKRDQESLCYQCHTDGGVENDALSNNRPGGYVSADDIQEAFSKSEKHDIGTSFTINSKNYTLECVSCHNVHIVTGKYWDTEQGNVSPVTKFTDNTEVWGDESGEKMNDFAAQGSGTGGFYYKSAQGYSLGATGLPFDRPAVYRPPKNGSGYDSEFEGDILPDYTTFCLDCHTYRVSAANPPVNWGQGISCTDNSVDPPDQRVECGADHGLGVAGVPYYVSDSGTPGFWGSSGNPDILFDMNYVTRGRNNGHFMRWPYDSADRGAGINFVLSCTDCHEAHGSNRGSMIRERFNVNANGDCGTGGDSNPNGENCADGGNWNAFCNACHYYYGGQHAGMSCGSNSCHETNSIHRIIHVTDSGASTKLMLTAAGYESNYSRPDFTPDISVVTGRVGSNNLTVNFTKHFVDTHSNLTGALAPEDFWLFDKNGDNPRTITRVIHTSNTSNATIIMSAPLIAADLSTDTLATRGKSVWSWYEGGYVNAATGTISAQVVSAGPWPVTISERLLPLISEATGSNGYDKLEVSFSEGVYTNPGRSGDLQPSDFNLTDADNGRTIAAVQHTAGEATVILTLNSSLDAVGDIGVDTLAANGIYNYLDDPVNTTPVTITQTPLTIITAAEGFVGGTKLKVTFAHWVYSNTNKTGALETADFVLTDVNGDNNRSITAVQHGAGDSFAVLTMSAPLISADNNTDTVAAALVSIFNSVDRPVNTTPVAITAQSAPSITSVEGTVGLDKLLVLFSEGVYNNTNMTGALQPDDFVFTDSDNGRIISSVNHTAGTAAAILTLNSTLDSSNDIGTDTLAAAGSAIYNRLDNPAGTSAVTVSGSNCPVGGTRFDFNEPVGSATVNDTTDLLVGQVGNSTYSMRGDGLYYGDETEAIATYIDVNNNNSQCLKSPRALTLEARVYVGDVSMNYVDLWPANGLDDDYDVGVNEGDSLTNNNGDGRNRQATRIAERQATFQFTIFNANYGGDYVEDRKDKARVILKYRVTDRGYCDGTYPGDSTVGDGAWFKQISSDIDQYPISSYHWYKIRTVFNTDKPRLVVDIFADDQGTDGNDTGELWSGYKNIARPDPESSSGCKWAAIPGLVMNTADKNLAIGDNLNHNDVPGDKNNLQLKGKLDWFEWKPIADYSGVDDLPY